MVWEVLAILVCLLAIMMLCVGIYLCLLRLEDMAKELIEHLRERMNGGGNGKRN